MAKDVGRGFWTTSGCPICNICKSDVRAAISDQLPATPPNIIHPPNSTSCVLHLEVVLKARNDMTCDLQVPLLTWLPWLLLAWSCFDVGTPSGRAWSCPAKNPEVGPLPMTVSVTFWVSFLSNNWRQIKERNIRMNLIKSVCVYIMYINRYIYIYYFLYIYMLT